MDTLEIDVVLSQLDPHQKQIGKHEAVSILARWEFGRVLRSHIPEGRKQLPKGLRDMITEKYGLEASEITRRMQLAENFKTEKQVVDASTKCGDSWRRMIRDLPKTPRKEKAEPSRADFKRATLNRWLREVNGDDKQHAELLALLEAAVKTMTDDAEVAA